MLYNPNSHSQQDTGAPIRATLIGHNTCSALGIAARDYAPVLALCRALVDAGYDPASPLEAYRGGVLALRIRSIGEAANLEVRPSSGSGTPVFIRRMTARPAPLVRSRTPVTITTKVQRLPS